jgi:hypothetical protein
MGGDQEGPQACPGRCYPSRFRRSREEGDFVKGRGRTNTQQAIETIKTGGAGDQAAELLAIALEKIRRALNQPAA